VTACLRVRQSARCRRAPVPGLPLSDSPADTLGNLLFPNPFLSQEFSLQFVLGTEEPNPAASPHTHLSPCSTDTGKSPRFSRGGRRGCVGCPASCVPMAPSPARAVSWGAAHPESLPGPGAAAQPSSAGAGRRPTGSTQRQNLPEPTSHIPRASPVSPLSLIQR